MLRFMLIGAYHARWRSRADPFNSVRIAISPSIPLPNRREMHSGDHLPDRPNQRVTWLTPRAFLESRLGEAVHKHGGGTRAFVVARVDSAFFSRNMMLEKMGHA
jgi:hypothetical protein